MGDGPEATATTTGKTVPSRGGDAGEASSNAVKCVDPGSLGSLSHALSHGDLLEAIDLATVIVATTNGTPQRMASKLLDLLARGRGRGAQVVDLDERRRR